MRRTAGRLAALAAATALCAPPASGSGGPPPTALYIDSKQGPPQESAALYGGRLGMVMRRSGDGLLYLDWRLLNGLAVGSAAGKALAAPCCGPEFVENHVRGLYTWLDLRRGMTDPPSTAYWISTERPGPGYTTIPNCFDDAFTAAAATLQSRINRYGARSAAVKAWVQAQDGVFRACSEAGVALPLPIAGAPVWLTADRAYQEAAHALYDGRFLEAEERFGAIARDSASPWQPKALYLQVRARMREVLARPSGHGFATARAAVARLAAAPAGTYGRGEAGKLNGMLDYRERPAEYLRELDTALTAGPAPAEVGPMFKDYMSLADRAQARPGPAEWIRTMQAEEREPGLARAVARWQESRHPVWLLAALSFAEPQDQAAPMLIEAAAHLPAAEPAALTARYHHIRLTMNSAGEAVTRRRLDALLARRDLTLTERNLFTAARAQVAADLADFARLAMRTPYCEAYDGECTESGLDYVEGTAKRGNAWVAFGPDARAIIDRLPLGRRLALSRLEDFPAELRLDLALTGFARAVQLQEHAATDAFARDLATLLPQMRRDWRTIAATRPGAAKRFAMFFAMAKLPGLRTDLTDFTRPEGTIRDFQGHWRAWTILPAAQRRPQADFLPAGRYLDDGWSTGPDFEDMTCLGKCGGGAFPLHVPAFVRAAEAQARAERAAFVRAGDEGVPADAVPVWEEALGYARLHRRDPRVPELLYRLIRVQRWGGGRDNLGKRAFQLLHARYPGSVWAKRSPFWYA